MGWLQNGAAPQVLAVLVAKPNGCAMVPRARSDGPRVGEGKFESDVLSHEAGGRARGPRLLRHGY